MLRSRMRQEFGRSSGNSDSIVDDNYSMTNSESMSLTSWGRNLINTSGDVSVVFPLDSMSTKVQNIPTLPLSGRHIVKPIFEDTGESFDTCRGSPDGTKATSPPKIPERPINNNNNISTLSPRRPSNISKETLTHEDEEDTISEMRGGKLIDSEDTSFLDTSEIGKKRGHAKTNSLDRGLSLAKAMKCGPFPPPPDQQSKANSLNRQCSPSDMFQGVCEEDQLNNEAKGVIQQITSDLLQTEILTDEDISEDDHFEDPGKGQENEVKPVIPDRTHLPELVKPVIPPRPDTVGEDSMVGTNDTKIHALEEPTDLIKKLSIEEKIVESKDPITRDVERRMSMKEDSSANSKSSTAEKRLSLAGHSNRPITAIKGATHSVKTFSQGIFRGALDKAKSVVFPQSKSVGKLATTKFIEEGDECDIEDKMRETTVTSPQTIPSQVHSPIQICRPKNSKKGPFDYSEVRVVQEFKNEHTGAIWQIKFSVCGKLFATVGHDNIVRVWCLNNYLAYFQKIRDKFNEATGKGSHSVSNFEVMMGMNVNMSDCGSINDLFTVSDEINSDHSSNSTAFEEKSTSKGQNIVASKPLCTFRGHTADIIEISWSKTYFILTCGMDKTVKLWHLSRTECLCCFQHTDCVTCVAFLPKDDRYFLSGSLDGKLRLWHIPEKKVAMWNEVDPVQFITAITFVKNGNFAVVGTFLGRCIFYHTDQLKYHTVIDVRSSRFKNSTGPKITGLDVSGDKLLVTSNDSRIRIYDLRDMNLVCKFKGAINENSKLRSSFSPSSRHIICGSEDRYTYIWSTSDTYNPISVRKDRNVNWQRIRGSEYPVSVAIFAPKPQLFMALCEPFMKSVVKGDKKSDNKSSVSQKLSVKNLDTELDASAGIQPLFKSPIPHHSSQDKLDAYRKDPIHSNNFGDIIITADVSGCIKVMVNPSKGNSRSNTFQSDT
uniref:WD repeat-containing protein 44 n=1 Tax=Rhabditophanes sp. KR3021 TaxID=114890 RepID=A0AC35TTR3_9BILA